MGTWPEARAARTERLRRESRHFTPDQLGKPCPECGITMPLALTELGVTVHPTCGPEARYAMRIRS